MKPSNGWAIPQVPGMSHKAAEQRAIEILRDYRPGLLREARPFPVPDFYEYYLYERHNLRTGIGNLPLMVEGLTEPDGTIMLAPNTYEKMLDGDGRARATAVHEGVHGIVHVTILSELNCAVRSGEQPVLYRAQDLPAYANPEWQARRITAAVMMPLATVRETVAKYGLDPDAVAETYQTSYSAAKIRLQQLTERGWLS